MHSGYMTVNVLIYQSASRRSGLNVYVDAFSVCGIQSVCLYIYIYKMCMWLSPAGLYFLKQQSVCVCPLPTTHTCIGVCVSLLAAQYVDSPSHTRAHVYTATSFSLNCSPSGRAPRIPGRRAPVRGLPSSARQPGTSPCFLYGSRTQRCPLRRAPPP